MHDEEKLDLIGCGVNIGSRWSKQNTIAELEKIKAYFEELANDEWNIQVGASKGLECAIDVIEDRISKLKEDDTQKSEPDDFHEYWDEIAIPD